MGVMTDLWFCKNIHAVDVLNFPALLVVAFAQSHTGIHGIQTLLSPQRNLQHAPKDVRRDEPRHEGVGPDADASDGVDRRP
jgi:hypothetical protein